MIIWVLLILAALLVVVIFLLPVSISAKLSNIATGVGILFAGYGVYATMQAEKKQSKLNEIKLNDEYWNRIFTLFIENESLNNMYEQIYGDSIPPEEYAMFFLMMQTVENIIEGAANNITRIDSEWIATIRKWISHPQFPIFWRQNASQFSPGTQIIIQQLLLPNTSQA